MKNYFLKVLAITTLGVVFACSKSDDASKPSTDQSIVKANFTKTFRNIRDTYFGYDLGDVTNNSWQAQVSVEGYNSNYTYEIKIKGDVLKKEYSVPLAFEKVSDTDTDISILNFVKEAFKADIDTYKAYIVEKETNTELEINIPTTAPDRPYFIVDADEPGFLYNFTFGADTNTSTAPLEELSAKAPAKTYTIFFAGNWGFASGFNLRLVFYDLQLNKVTSAVASMHVNDGNAVYYTIKQSDLKGISTTGDYFVRLEGTAKSAEPKSSSNTIKVADNEKNSPYQKIRVKKVTSGALISSGKE